MFSKIFKMAKANIKGSTKYPKINGIITFKEAKDGVLVTAKINGLPQSKDHCTRKIFWLSYTWAELLARGNLDDEFANAKSHYNPTKCPHPFHIGDLPPLIENNGYAYMSVLINKIKIKDIIGRVIIIHDMPDDFTTQPSGNSGGKIACGKIL